MIGEGERCGSGAILLRMRVGTVLRAVWLALPMVTGGAQTMMTVPAGKVVPAPVIPPGTVSGHVICADTNGPARFASVTLTPVVGPKIGKQRDKEGSSGPRQISRIVRTALDGSFTMIGVAPGNYYMLADAPGYQAASGQLTREQMDKPTEAVTRLMAQMLTPVSVASNRGSTVEVRLLRGASVTGSVRFDDGTAYSGAPVRLWRKTDEGKWDSFYPHPMLNTFGVSTDDAGRFRFAGLPAGEYRVATELSIEKIWTDNLFSSNRSWSNDGNYSIHIYQGGSVREKDAKTLKLGSGEDASDVEIEVPLSKLHTVEGSLAEQGSGRQINAGKVALLYADDGKELVSSEVSAEDGGFHLPYVPEGDYRVKVSEARDVTREEISNGPDSMPPFHTDTKTVRTFGEATQAVKVVSDVSGLIVTVPPSNDAAKTAQ